MTIEISTEFENFIQQQVSCGNYSSSAEALEYAYRMLRERELIRKQRIEELNSDIKKGLESSATGNLISESQLKEHIQKRRNNFING